MYIEFKELEIDETKFGCVRKDAKGEERPMFNLDEEQTMILASGYNVKLRQQIIKRWMELELSKPKEMTFEEMKLKRLERENKKLHVIVNDYESDD